MLPLRSFLQAQSGLAPVGVHRGGGGACGSLIIEGTAGESIVLLRQLYTASEELVDKDGRVEICKARLHVYGLDLL